MEMAFSTVCEAKMRDLVSGAGSLFVKAEKTWRRRSGREINSAKKVAVSCSTICGTVVAPAAITAVDRNTSIKGDGFGFGLYYKIM